VTPNKSLQVTFEPSSIFLLQKRSLTQSHLSSGVWVTEEY